MNFWQKFKKEGPIFVLAPMADVTDAAFRQLISQNSDISHITYTEFVSADGLVLAPAAGRKKLLKDLEYTAIERPIVAQFFSSKPEMMEQAAALALSLGFDGVDINMGCPDKSIEKQGAGAALIKNPTLAQELILAAKRGVKNKIPVSVKTRLGYNKDELENWLPVLLEAEPAAIIIHARTRKEMSKVPARWERIKQAVEIRNQVQNSPVGAKESSCQTLIIGNGDVINVDDASRKCKETGADGAMLGRAVFGNPFIFRQNPPTVKEKLEALILHINLFEEKLSGIKNFAIMKKHFKSYLKEVDGHKDLKQSLMLADSAEAAIRVVKNILLFYN